MKCFLTQPLTLYRTITLYNFDIVDRQSSKYSIEVHDKVLDLLINNLAVYSAGHPRSLDAIVWAIQKHLKKDEPTRLHVILDSACDKMHGNLRPVTVTVVESLLARSVSYSDIIPNSSPELSFDMAIANGSLIGSNISKDHYVPFLSPVAYSNYIKDCKDSEDLFAAFLAKTLRNVLGVQPFFSFSGFEMVAYTREVLMSAIRNKLRSPPESFRGLLRDAGLYSSDCYLLNVSLESSTCFSVQKFAQIKDYVSCNKSDIYVPENSNNPGFDFFIRFPTADKRFLNVVYGMKYSDPASIRPGTLSKSLIVENHYKCKEIFGEKFVFVVFGWREKTASLSPSDLPANTVV